MSPSFKCDSFENAVNVKSLGSLFDGLLINIQVLG